MGENHNSAPRLSGMWVGLSEAFAWISTRDATFARGLGHTSPFKLSVALVKHHLDAGRRPSKEIDAAQASLVSALRHADVLARGRCGNLFELIEASQEIPADRWAFMLFGETGRKFRAQSEDGQTPEFWHDLLVRSDQLLAAFPARSGELSAAPVDEVFGPAQSEKENREGTADIISPSAGHIDPQSEDRHPADDGDGVKATYASALLTKPTLTPPILPEPSGEAFGPPRPTSKEIAEAEFTRWLETAPHYDGKPSPVGRPTQRSLKRRKDKIYKGLRGPSDRRMKDHLRTLSQPYTHIDWKLTGPAREAE